MSYAASNMKRSLPAPARAAIGGLGGTATTLAGLAGAWIAYSTLAVHHAVPLPKAIDAERRTFQSPVAGGVSYYVAREAAGRPLVLVHSVNAAASAYEMGPIFAYYRRHRPVYALDLPGYGFSERSDRAYSPALYAAAVADLLSGEVREAGPVDVVALSLGSEFAAFAARALPDHVRSLALISPTGIGYRGDPLSETARDEGERAIDRRLRAFAFPLWAQAFYDLLVTPPSIRYFLKQSFAGSPDEGLVEYDRRTSHQPGARHAPLHFVSGALFTRDVRATVYERLEQPTLVLYDQDAFVSFDTLPDLLNDRPNWQAVRITPTRGLPHFEQPARTFAALDRFWSGVDAGAPGAS